MSEQIDFSIADAFVSDMQSKKDELDTYYKNLEGYIETLFADWKGSAADQFQVKSSTYLTQLENLRSSYETAISQITTIIDNWKEAEAAATEIGTTRTC